MGILKLGVVAALAAAHLRCGAGQTTDVERMVGALAFARHAECSRNEVGARPRADEPPRLFAEFLVKYGQFQNYFHYWIDRPLYWNRAMRPAGFAYETCESFGVHARELKKSGLDGFDVFANLKYGKGGAVVQLNDWLGKLGARDLCVVPIVSYGESVDKYGPNCEAFATAVRAAQGDARFPRFGGKVLVPTYNYRLFDREQHADYLTRLRAALGNDDFVLCGDLNFSKLRAIKQAFAKNGRLAPEEQARLDGLIRDVLDVAGGIQCGVADLVRDPTGPYCSHYDTTFFERVLTPTLKRLYALPQYRGKALGLYIQQGYINHHSGHDHAEDGTATLRHEMTAALSLNPDYYIFFEWNEVNENTMFQPTVWNGHAVSRLLRQYANVARRHAPDAFPGDETTIPNLTLSHRATLKVGERLDFEILNIPDGVRSGTMRVQLRLETPSGECVTAYPVETMDATTLNAVTYETSTVALRGGDVLVPTLVVDGRAYSGFHPIRLSPTVAWNYKCLRQNLRDQLQPVATAASVERTAANRYRFQSDLSFSEPLASLELIVNENEQTAAGLAAEYDLTSNELVRLSFTTATGFGLRDSTLTIRTPGVTGVTYIPLWIANVNPRRPQVLKDGSGITLNPLIWGEELAYFALVPKGAADRAVFEISLTGKGFSPVTLPVKTILERGVVSALFGDHPVRVDARRMDDLPDLPRHLASAASRWSGETTTDVHAPVFHFRAIAASGKIWRSRPFVPAASTAPAVPYPVWDEFARTPATGYAPEDLIPSLDYVFSPETGVVLANSWETAFAAQLGGGFPSDQAFSTSLGVLPGRRAPIWTREDDAWCLRFDGTNDYINLPKEAFPQAAFTLEMEIKPEFEPTRQMVLFRHFDRIRGSLSLFIREGRLFATWGDKVLTKEPSFATGLEVTNGGWNAISVSYDFREFVFRVNGREKRFPWVGRAWCFKPSIFGGHTKVELSASKSEPVYFKGLLRKFAIRHR